MKKFLLILGSKGLKVVGSTHQMILVALIAVIILMALVVYRMSQ